MKNTGYQTIKTDSRGYFKDRGSKFLAFAFPAANENDINNKLDNLRREYHDARHHCYAWRLGAEKDQFRANDDGEPSGTAGRPILGQIEKHDLTNILIIVIRYFGGTLLGTGGLINAYRSAAADAIERSVIVTKTVDQIISVSFPYESMNNVMKIVKDERAEQIDQNFGTDCNLLIRVPVAHSNRVLKRLSLLKKVAACEKDS